jgi:hypothetical protein
MSYSHNNLLGGDPELHTITVVNAEQSDDILENKNVNISQDIYITQINADILSIQTL